MLLLGALLVGAETASAAAIARPANNLGLVGYWPFDEGHGTQAGDFSGNGRNGTLINSPQWVAGKVGGALDFNGSTTYVELPTEPTLTNNFTLSAWIYRRSTSGRILDKGNIGTDPSGAIEWTPGSLVPNNSTSATVSTSPPLNEWVHVAVTFSSGTVRFYQNGQFISQSNMDWTSFTAHATHIWKIGRRASAADANFNGLIDEVRMYNRVLSDAEVAGLHQTSRVVVNASSALLTSNSSLSTGLLAHWTFDGQDIDWSLLTMADRSGQGRTGTLTGFTQASAVIGRLGQALQFNGTTANVAVSSALTVPGMSVSFWANPAATQNTFPRILGTSDTVDHEFVDATNAYRFRYGNNTHQDSNSSYFIRGAWNFYTVTYDRSTVRFYRNGALFSSHAYARSQATYNLASIGSTAAGNQRFNGSFDDMRIYNRVLSDAEVGRLYRLGR